MKALTLILISLTLIRAEVLFAHTPEDVSAFKTERDGEMYAYLYYNGDQQEPSYWNSLTTYFMGKPSSYDNLEDDEELHLLKIDCRNDRLKDYCSEETPSLNWIKVYDEQGTLLLEETPNAETEKKIEAIRSGKPTQVETSYDREISPSPMLVEQRPTNEQEQQPEPQPKQESDTTMVKDFNYSPTDIHTEHSFGQDQRTSVVQKKMFKPIDHPQVDRMNFAHTFGTREQPWQDMSRPVVVDNPFRQQTYYQRQAPQPFATAPALKEEEVVYVPLTEDEIMQQSSSFVYDFDDAGDVYYIFEQYDDEDHITPLQDLSTVDPEYYTRGALKPSTWFGTDIPKDEQGREIFPNFDSYVPPVNIAMDRRPYYEAHNDRSNDWWLKERKKTVMDENYIPTYKQQPFFSGKATEYANQWTIPTLDQGEEVETTVNKVKIEDETPLVVDYDMSNYVVEYDPDSVNDNVVTVGRTGD